MWFKWTGICTELGELLQCWDVENVMYFLCPFYATCIFSQRVRKHNPELIKLDSPSVPLENVVITIGIKNQVVRALLVF